MVRVVVKFVGGAVFSLDVPGGDESRVLPAALRFAEELTDLRPIAEAYVESDALFLVGAVPKLRAVG